MDLIINAIIKIFTFINNYLISGILPSVPVQCDQLPVSATEELRGGQSEQEQMPVLQTTEVYGTGNVQRW